jgi:hypothetical protein
MTGLYSGGFYAGRVFITEKIKDFDDSGYYTIGNVLTVFFSVIIGGFSIGTIPPALTAISDGL